MKPTGSWIWLLIMAGCAGINVACMCAAFIQDEPFKWGNAIAGLGCFAIGYLEARQLWINPTPERTKGEVTK